MSAPRFREGDICRYLGARVAREVRIVRVLPDPLALHSVRYQHEEVDGPGSGVCTDGGLVLLRRPVRLGDTIRLRGFDAKRCWWLVGGQRVPCTLDIVVSELDRNKPGVHGIAWDAVEHADGTAVEPPRAEFTGLELPNGNGGVMKVTTNPPGLHKVMRFDDPIEPGVERTVDPKRLAGMRLDTAPSFADIVDRIQEDLGRIAGAELVAEAPDGRPAEWLELLSVPTGTKIQCDRWCPDDTFVILVANGARAQQFSDLIVALDKAHQKASRLADEAQAASDAYRRAERRVDELELQLRRAGLTPKPPR